MEILLLYSLITSYLLYDQNQQINESENLRQDNAGSIVSVEFNTKTKYHRGTGFVVTAKSGKQVILTNAHVCRMFSNPEKAPFIISTQATKSTALSHVYYAPVPVIAESDFNDLCIIEMPKKLKAKSLPLVDSVTINSKVTIIGYPNYKIMSSSTGYTRGFTSNCIDTFYSDDEEKDKTTEECKHGVARFLFTDALGDKGQSGAPALNSNGEVVGILSYVSGKYRSFSVLVPVSDIKKFLSKY